MKIVTFISDEQDKLAPPEDIEKLIEDCTAAALEEEGIDDSAEVSVTFVDNEGIRELNKEHRDIDRETDVLSFPLGDDENGYEVDPDTDAIMLGDIVISLEKAKQQAEEYGHSYRREVAFLLTHSLFHLLGYDTRMIRTTDTSIYTKGETIAQKKISDLKERVRIVNETENALLLSIHQNNITDGRYSGAQVFYAGTEGSAQLAKLLQERLVSTLTPGSNRKCKKSDGVYLMEHIDCTGVLIECGFLSNAEEEAKLSCGTYQKKLCCVIAATVSQYLSNT